MLAEDQTQAVREITSWWNSSKAFHVLDGKAGVGKSYAVEHALKQLPGAEPFLLAPTHKALGQLREKTKGDYQFRTVANALGIRPIHGKKDLVFEHTALSSIWEQKNLAVIDEAGLLDDFHLELIRQTNTKVLFVGHKSQLPPPKEGRSMHDTCDSPVFAQGFGVSSLWIPKRNTGKLWDYCNVLEDRIYDGKLPEPKDYDIKRKELYELFDTDKDDFLSGKTKIALWTNDGVDKYNEIIRISLYGNTVLPKYIIGDLVSCLGAFTSVPDMEYMNDAILLRKAATCEDVYSDTDGVVVEISIVLVKLNAKLHIPCYKLKVNTSLGDVYMYDYVNSRDSLEVGKYYEHRAWGIQDRKAKDKAFMERAAILKCFAKVRHFYANTCHRFQGSSVPNMIVIHSDINKNPNRIERAKCLYVGSSRAIDNLYAFKGI